MNIDSIDRRHMRRALEIAHRGLFSTEPNPRVGCVIVKNNEVIGEGWHQVAGQHHAEKMALENCHESPEGADCYVSLEPCSHHGKTAPCSDSLIDSGIKRVIVAMVDPNPRVSGEGIEQLRTAGIQVETGLMEKEARELNPGFIKRMEQGLPFVTCKMGMSLDGRTAMASGESQWITSWQSRQDVQLLRARSGAIITGSGTVLVDNPSMNVRVEDFPDGPFKQQKVEQPWRVIMDTEMKVSPDSKIFSLPGKVIWVTTKDISECQNTDRLEHVKLPADKNAKIDPKALLHWLADKGCNEVMIEAGARLSGAFINQNLVDKLKVYMAPKILGDKARGLVELPGMTKLTDAKLFKLSETRVIGDDICLTYIKM